MNFKNFFRHAFIVCIALSVLFFVPAVFAQEQDSSVEINGDIVEYMRETSTVIARGNVVIYHTDSVLTCDRVEFFQDEGIAYAEGNVRQKINNTFTWSAQPGPLLPASA